MDDELLSLEAELQRLRPVAPRRQVMDEISSRLSERPLVHLGRWAGLALPIAAALAVIVVLQFPGKRTDRVVGAEPPQDRVAESFRPVSAKNRLVSSRDEGLVTLTDGTPARRYRQLYVDTIVWRNPKTQASLAWTLPREEVRVLPISYQ